MSQHGADFYGLPRNEGRIVLKRAPQTLAVSYPFDGDEVSARRPLPPPQTHSVCVCRVYRLTTLFGALCSTPTHTHTHTHSHTHTHTQIQIIPLNAGETLQWTVQLPAAE